MEKSASIIVSGDFCPINKFSGLLTAGNEILSGEVKDVWKSSAYRITNLECPVTEATDAIVKTGPHLKASPIIANGLKLLNVDLCTLANNHILDYGSKGLLDSVSFCQKNNIEVVGAGGSYEQARRAVTLHINGMSISVLNFCENEFSTTTSGTPGANPVNPVQNYYDIVKAAQATDHVIVIVHGGKEHFNLPSPSIVELFRFYVDAGATAVIAHHPHCFSGYELYKNVPIFYSLGNFVFDHDHYRSKAWNQGYFVELFFTDKANPPVFSVLPYVQGEKDDPTVRGMTNTEKEIFDKEIKDLNETISNSVLLKKKWDDYLQTQKRSYRNSALIPSGLLRKAVIKGVISASSITSKKQTALLLNLVRCETHRDILIESLKDAVASEERGS